MDEADPPSACGITAGLSVALDFDDYLFLGHTGHSAVSVPLVLGAYLGADQREALVAQVIANEVGGRLGSSVVLGPHNGQLWTFIHAANAALAASRLLGLDAERTAHALDLALAAPPYPSFSSIMSADSKLAVVAEPTAAGVRAAYLAREGLTGPLDILDDERGFYAGFSFVPSRFFLDGFGKSWVMQSIAIKPYPGCAYVDAMVDSLLDILGRFEAERGRKVRSDDVREIHVEASILTAQMEAIGEKYAPADGLPSSFNINFRIPHTAALALIAGRLTSAEFAPDFLGHHADEIAGLASRVRLSHDWEMTLNVVRAIVSGLEPFSPVAYLSLSDIRRAFRGMRTHMSPRLPLALPDILQALFAVKPGNIVKLVSAARKGGSMADVDFGRMRFPFAARVTLKTTDGKSYESGRELPDGSPGGRSRREVAGEKLLQEAAVHIGKERAEALLSAVEGGGSPAEIADLLKPEPA